jgi:hypothetical protein
MNTSSRYPEHDPADADDAQRTTWTERRRGDALATQLDLVGLLSAVERSGRGTSA